MFFFINALRTVQESLKPIQLQQAIDFSSQHPRLRSWDPSLGSSLYSFDTLLVKRKHRFRLLGIEIRRSPRKS